MTTRNRAAAVVVSLLLAMPRVSMASPDCAQEIDELQGHLRDFDSEAREMGPGFLRADVMDVTLDAAKKKLDGMDAQNALSPVWKGAREAEEAKNRLTSWDERVKTWGKGILGYRNCQRNPEQCSIADLLEENAFVDKQLADWLKSLGDEGIEKATERVEKAAELLKNYVAKAGNTAIGATAAAATCLADHSPRSASAPTQEPVQLADPPRRAGGKQTAAASKPARRGGLSPGGQALVVLSTLAITGGVVAYVCRDGACTTPSTSDGSSGSGHCSNRSCVSGISCSCAGVSRGGTCGGMKPLELGQSCYNVSICREGLLCVNGTCSTEGYRDCH